jgi:hypothetical protein
MSKKKEEALCKEIAAIREQEKALKERRESLQQEYAELVCPYAVGQRLSAQGGRKTYEVTAIGWNPWRDQSWEIRGRRVRKDGTLGVREMTIWPHELDDPA